jgi:hypothetical protein
VTLLQRWNALDGLACLDPRPIPLEFATMQDRPLADEPERRPGVNLPCDRLAGKIERGLLAVMLGVEVRGLMFLIEHANDNPEENRYDRHPPSIASSLK